MDILAQTVDSSRTLRELIGTNSAEMVIWRFIGGLGLTMLICWLLSLLYTHCGRSLSNREAFARNFVVLGMTTMLIISIVRSSLALSLGLVGALSIVRFRTAIKEPEELAYLFLTIGVGLGFGAEQWQVTIVAVTVIAAFLYLRHLTQRSQPGSNLYLTVRSSGASKLSLTQITDAIRPQCHGLDLKRYDEAKDEIEVSYLVSFEDYQQLDRAKQALESCGDSVRVSFVDNEGLV